jgi:UDP-2,3-diacylglucosamine pyrophosphatase LpxH
MITNVREDRLVVTSDTHIGSFFCNARPGLIRLLEFARDRGYNACINGDGIDVLHSSLEKMTMEASMLLRELRRLSKSMTLYYTVGNHDILLEHYLGEWGAVQLVPFLNLESGRRRIRIEHGHLYDPFLMKYPELQPALTRFIGWCCRFHPPWYELEERIKHIRYTGIPGMLGRRTVTRSGVERHNEHPAFLEAAEEIAARGFDAVIFGHTHHPGVIPIRGGSANYVNTGAWSRRPHFATIESGVIELKPWPS